MKSFKADTDYIPSRVFNWKSTLWIGSIVCGLALFVMANVHFIYVAFDSQPECVSHQKRMDGNKSNFSAAKPSC